MYSPTNAAFRVANDGYRQAPPRVVPLITMPLPPLRSKSRTKRIPLWTIPVFLGIAAGIALWFLYVPEPLTLMAGVPDAEMTEAPTDVITPVPTDVVVPAPAVPGSYDEPIQAYAQPILPVDGRVVPDGIVLPASSLEEPPSPDKISAASADDPAVAFIAGKIADGASRDKNIQHIVMRPAGTVVPGRLLEEAHAQLQAGDDHAAIASFDRILASDAANRGALEGKAFALERISQFEPAVAVYHHLLKLYPRDDAARANLMAALGQWGAPPALAELQKWVTDDPDFGPAQAALARALVNKGDIFAALPHARRAAEVEPNNLMYRLDLAIFYDQLGHSSEALALYRQVLTADTAERPAVLPISLQAVEQRIDYLDNLMDKVQQP